MEKLDYPIKYAILGIEEQVGHNYLGWAEPIYGVSGYIVSKVYLVGEPLEYLSDGTSRKSYQVVFPFPYPSLKGFSLRIVPERNACNQYGDAVNVSEVFDDFEQAKVCANAKNEELKNRRLATVSLTKPGWQEEMGKIEKDFNQLMEKVSRV